MRTWLSVGIFALFVTVTSSAQEVSSGTSQAVVSGDKGDVILDGSGTPWPATVAGVFLRPVPQYPDVTARLGYTTGQFRVLAADNSQLLNVSNSGNVGIGNTLPDYSLDIRRDQNAATAIRIYNENAGSASQPAMRSIRFAGGGSILAEISSVGSASTGYAGGANSLNFWNIAAGPAVIGTSDLERMRVHANGNVSIGTPSDIGGRLGIRDIRDTAIAVITEKYTTVEAAVGQRDMAVATTALQTLPQGVSDLGTSAVGTYSAGLRAGQGTSYRTIGVHALAGMANGESGTVSHAYGYYAQVLSGTGTVANGVGMFIEDLQAQTGWGIYQNGSNDINFFGGSVGIGVIHPQHKLHVAGDGRITGDLTVDGNIAAKFQDLAEWVPATDDLSPGTVVTLDRTASNTVTASTRAYDTAVAGVVSEQPGIVLGERGASKEQIATTGRVKVRVDATAGPIRIGDLLVSSDRPGTAMKSQPVDVQGISMHRPGTVIGKALEPLESGVGEILVLLSLQ